jgi:hypothetical protein
MPAAASRYAGAQAQYVSRLPCVSRTPSALTGNASGCRRLNHGGGEAVGVARSTCTPALPSRSITWSSQPNSYRPGSGSRLDQAKTPTVTRLTPASRISATSSFQTCGGHCSGL